MSNRLKTLLASTAPTVAVESQKDKPVEKAPVVDLTGPALEHAEANLALATVGVEHADGDVNELMEIAAGLESICGAASATIPEGGLKRSGAAMLHVAVEGYANRLGLEESFVPGIESFGSEGEAITATQVSVEGIKETIQRVWEAVKAAVLKAIEAVKAWFAKFFINAEKIKARAEAIKAGVKDKTGDAKESKVSVGSAVAKLHKGGKLASVSTVAAEVKTVLGNVVTAQTELTKTAGALGDIVGKVAKENAEKGAELLVEAGLKLVEAPQAFKGALDLKESTVDGEKAYFSDELFGGKVIKMVADEKSYSASLQDKADVKLDDADKEVSTLAVADIESLCDLVIDCADELAGAKDTVFDKGSDVKNDLLKAGKDASAALRDDADKAVASNTQAIVRMLPTFTRMVDQPSMALLAHSATALGGVLDIAAASSKQYE
tara:strand:+ start:9449 stop:10759 length:1311 start_codon:yes stop_codon:yes gene_type:complete